MQNNNIITFIKSSGIGGAVLNLNLEQLQYLKLKYDQSKNIQSQIEDYFSVPLHSQEQFSQNIINETLELLTDLQRFLVLFEEVRTPSDMNLWDTTPREESHRINLEKHN